MSDEEHPKKIALKVPALFIKSGSSPATENGGDKKPARPMPASMKKKLEERKSEPIKSETDSQMSSDSRKEVNEVPKKPSRPMPASARKKLEEKSDRESDKESVCSSVTSSRNGSLERPRKPMPATVKQKYSATATENDDDESSDKTQGVHSPNSANNSSILEVGDSEERNQNQVFPTKPILSEVKKPNRAMPASAHKKLEALSDSNSSDSDKTSVISKAFVEDDVNETLPKDVDGSAVEESVNETEGNQLEVPTKKINISLGGITFPTFKKPMPSSVKRKLEEQAKDKDKTQVSSSVHDASKNGDSIATTGRRSRRDGGSEELFELKDATYPCEECGTVFLSSYALKKHKLSHQIKEGDAIPKPVRKKSKCSKPKKGKTKPKESMYKGMTNCPHCLLHFGNNVKKLKNHAWKCKKRQHLKTEKSSNDSSETLNRSQGADFNNDAIPIPISVDEFMDEGVPSPISATSSKSSNHSTAVKRKPMPKSVKEKVLKEEVNTSNSSDAEAARITGVQMFKQKIASVLSTLGARRFQTSEPQQSDHEEADATSPPIKKRRVHDEEKEETDCSNTMAPSTNKKQETSSPEPPAEALDVKPTSPISLLVCEVCLRVLSSSNSRRRHEVSVHKLANSRPVADLTTSQIVPKSRSGSAKKKVSKSSSKATVSKTVSTVESGNSVVSEDSSKSKPSTGIDFDSLPNQGHCPICGKFVTRMKRHIGDVHKVKLPGTTGTAPVKGLPVVRPVSKSFKIYKTATKKIKQKLTSTAPKKPSQPQVKLVQSKDLTKMEASGEDNATNTESSDLRCACCDKIFEVTCDFYEHMTLHEPKVKRLITCKLCDHKFSHEDDFLLHMQFRHKDVLGRMKEKSTENSTSKLASRANTTGVPEDSKDSSRRTRTSLRRASSDTRKRASSKENLRPCKVWISKEERKIAEDFMEKFQTRTGPEPVSARSTRRTSTFRSRTPESVTTPLSDTEHFDENSPMDENDDGQSQIVITSISSQKNLTSTPLIASSNDLDPMQCSSCSDVFYSYEALKKHELYFHNIKNSNMCPICGVVFPTRLARHLIAHENKTIRRTCLPCRLNFDTFAEMRLHNIQMHLENKKDVQITSKPIDGLPSKSNNVEDTVFRCRLCSKEFGRQSIARGHIRRVHGEQECDPDELLDEIKAEKSRTSDAGANSVANTKVDSEAMEVDTEVEAILKDTNQKLLDPDWDNDDDSVSSEVKQTATRDLSMSSHSSEQRNPKGRPMPASARAKLLNQQDQLSEISKTSGSSAAGSSKAPARPMPASVRAKLDAQKQIGKSLEGTSPQPEAAPERKESMTQAASTSSSNTAPKPRRPMPASVRAKLRDGPAEELNNLKENVRPTNNTQPKSPEDVIMLEDDDDDEPVNVSVAGAEEPVDDSSFTPLFGLSDQIEEHNRAVEMAMSGQSVNNDFSLNMFQCKLCSQKFGTVEETRRHIKRSHEQHDPFHVETLILRLFESIADTPRRRRTNVRYNEDYIEGEDDDGGVIIPRNSSTRTNQLQEESWTGTPSFDFTSGLPEQIYACKFCGRRKDSARNIKRHLPKAHPHYANRKEECVMIFDTEEEYDAFKAQLDSSAVAVPQPKSGDGGNSIFVCKVCSRCMTVRASLYMHIMRSHPEVRADINACIQELNGNGHTSNGATEGHVEDDTDSGFYCSICSYKTSDEEEYVAHYKGHTGVSPYQCPDCSATFDRQQQLSAHLASEHSSAKLLEETEVTLDDVRETKISVTTPTKIQVNRPKTSSTNSDSTPDNDTGTKTYTPGPASRKTAAARKMHSEEQESSEPMEVEEVPSAPASPAEDESDTNNKDSQQRVPPSVYQGDLSSLFPTLGGVSAPGGIEALDDIDGGMGLD